jgi:hypothetical protein
VLLYNLFSDSNAGKVILQTVIYIYSIQKQCSCTLHAVYSSCVVPYNIIAYVKCTIMMLTRANNTHTIYTCCYDLLQSWRAVLSILNDDDNTSAINNNSSDSSTADNTISGTVDTDITPTVSLGKVCNAYN